MTLSSPEPQLCAWTLRDPRVKPLEGVPNLKDLKLNAEQLKMAKFLTNTWSLLRLYAVPPGTAPERAKILRQAFLKALNSPKLKKDAKRQGVIVAPLSAEQVTRTIKELYKSPPDLREKYRKMVGW